MTGTDLFQRANYLFHRQAYQQWHRLRSKQQILRSQVGFGDACSARPRGCEGCLNYHGLSYGTAKDRRTPLVCAMHPYGWQGTVACPDWSSQ